LKLAFEGVTGAQHNATLFTMWRVYLLREPLGDKFEELVNVMVLWSALRRAATRESGFYADTGKLEKYRTALFRKFVAGKLKGTLIPLRRAEILGRRLVERIERRLMSSAKRRQRDAHRRWVREQKDERRLYREIPDIVRVAL